MNIKDIIHIAYRENELRKKEKSYKETLLNAFKEFAKDCKTHEEIGKKFMNQIKEYHETSTSN